MPRYEVAHIREHGTDIVIIPLEPTFDSKSPAEKTRTRDELQLKATAAGLAGTVALVWEHNDRMAFFGPNNLHTYLGSLNMALVLQSVNKFISW
jgi:hypothetical protein